MKTISVFMVAIALFGAACASLVGKGTQSVNTNGSNQQDVAGRGIQDGGGQGIGSQQQGPSLNGTEDGRAAGLTGDTARVVGGQLRR